MRLGFYDPGSSSVNRCELRLRWFAAWHIGARTAGGPEWRRQWNDEGIQFPTLIVYLLCVLWIFFDTGRIASLSYPNLLLYFPEWQCVRQVDTLIDSMLPQYGVGICLPFNASLKQAWLSAAATHLLTFCIGDLQDLCTHLHHFSSWSAVGGEHRWYWLHS
jgi:hypothetical protein